MVIVDASQEGFDNVPSYTMSCQFKFWLIPLNGELTQNGDVFVYVTWWRPQVECYCLFF